MRAVGVQHARQYSVEPRVHMGISRLVASLAEEQIDGGHNDGLMLGDAVALVEVPEAVLHKECASRDSHMGLQRVICAERMKAARL